MDIERKSEFFYIFAGKKHYYVSDTIITFAARNRNKSRAKTSHPFSDGNGRTGRVINILYLVLQDLLDLPVLYLSRYIIKNKGEYYRLLQGVRENADQWTDWILFMLKGIEETSIETIVLIKSIKELMMAHMKMGRDNFYLNIQLFELLMNAFHTEQPNSSSEKVATY